MGWKPNPRELKMKPEKDLSQYDILAVDDVPLNLLLLEKMLARFNIHIRKAVNGEEAMEEILAKKPDLVILDLIMPVMDGFEVLQKVRKMPDGESIKIIVLSALNKNEDIVRAYNCGANDFITKPIIFEKLINSVDNQLKRVK